MARTIRTQQGDTADLIAHREYGRTDGTTEAILAANPGLAKRGPKLPEGLLVTIPADARPATSVREVKRIWS